MLEIPDSPDLYTTTYENFKGVDMTNDASNIWKYRMAEGLNMAPDEAGQPWKRTGWEIAIPESSFKTAFNTATGQTATSVSTQRVYYFELHSQDHMAVIADVTYSSSSVAGCVFLVRQEGTTDNVFMLKTASTTAVSSLLRVDANRCFFFEGNGTAGFYMFKKYASGDETVNNMYIYTYEVIGQTAEEEDIYGFNTRTVEPYVPTIIVGRSADGGDGTLLDGANMLTSFRNVRFYGDYSHSKNEFLLPSTIKANTTVTVEMLNGEGSWVDVPSDDTSYPWSIGSSRDKIVFTNTPPDSPITGEDNVSITYETTGYTVNASSSSDSIVCSTGEILTESKTRTDTVTYTYRRSGSVSYTVSRTSTVATSGSNYIPRITFTVTATAVSGTKSASSTEYGDWSTSSYSASGRATGTKVIDPTADVHFYKTVSGTTTELEDDEYTTSLNSYDNTLTLTLLDVSELTESSSTTRTSSGTTEGSEIVDTDSTTYTTYHSSFRVDGDTATTRKAATVFISLFNKDVDDDEVIAYAKGESSTLTYGTAYTPTVLKNSSVASGGSYTTTANNRSYSYTYTTFKYTISTAENSVTIDTDTPNVGTGMKAFMNCSRATLFGSGLLNAVFMTGSSEAAYTSRVWYSGTGDPTYFPDTNYIEAGSNDTNIMGMIRVGEYLGIIKQGTNLDATIYLAYPTSYDDNTTYAIKQSITGVGAVSQGAFNIISDDSLFLSAEGVMAMSPDDTDRMVKNRSYFINKPLAEEDNLASAVSFVYDGMYILCVPRLENDQWTGVCYVLDGSQKTSWANEKTNLQFEAYYWENIPAKCFAKYDDKLWFIDFRGNLCRFKPVDKSDSYHDDYSATNTKCVSWTGTKYGVVFNQTTYDTATQTNKTFRYTTEGWKEFTTTITTGCTVDEDTFIPAVGSAGKAAGETYTFSYSNNEWKLNNNTVSLSDYGITVPASATTVTVALTATAVTLSTYGMTITDGVPDLWNKIEVKNGVPIKARFATVSDNDGATQYFKNLNKKGVVVSLLPKKETGATVYVKADEKDAVKTTVVKGEQSELPSDVFIKKKIKKYKRLQFVVENNNYDETFGVDAITKTYTIGNFSKNRRTT